MKKKLKMENGKRGDAPYTPLLESPSYSMPTKRRKQAKKMAPHPLPLFELEFLQGLRPFVLKELRDFKHAKLLGDSDTAIHLNYHGQIRELFSLRRAVALYSVTRFAVPRPKALLGDQHFRRLATSLKGVLALHEQGTFKSFRFGAAGSTSSVFQRLSQELSRAIELPFDAEEGDLFLRVRRTAEGWEVLTRLTPKPLSARDWRVCNLAGGLNATLATVMNDLIQIKEGDHYLNAMCGSGTLLIEQALSGGAARLVGCDLSEKALACTRENIEAAALVSEIKLLKADATNLPLEDSSSDVITADVPWGDAVGTHEGNAQLYPAFLKEMARIAAPQARFALLTHDIKLFERILKNQSDWQVDKNLRVSHSGHHPKLYLLKTFES